MIENKNENYSQSITKEPEIVAPKQIDHEKHALDLLSSETPISQKLLADYHEALVAAKIAIKEEDGSYLIDLNKVWASENGSRLDKITDYHFLSRAVELVPELAPTIKTFFEKVRDQEFINAVDQQIFLNELFDPKKQIFFDKKGQEASFEQYLRSIYGEMVQIIKVETNYLQPELLKIISDELKKSAYKDETIIFQLSKYLDQVPMTSILIQVADRQFLVPIMSITMNQETVGAFSHRISDQLNLICINTNLQAGTLLDTFCSIAHETDHAIHNLLNKTQWPEFYSTQEERIKIYDLLKNNYSGATSLELFSKYGESHLAVGKRDFDRYIKIKTITTEMGGEAGRLRFLDSLNKGLLKNITDPQNQELAHLVRAIYLDHIMTRLSSINDNEQRPYALANHLYIQIKEKYGEEEVLRIIHQLPLDQVFAIFEQSTQLSQKILEKEKVNFDKYNIRIFGDYFSGKVFSQINLEQLLDDKNDGLLTEEDFQQLLDEKVANSLNGPEQKTIYEQIKQYFNPDTSDLLLANINTISEIINLLAQDNLAFSNYLYLHPEELLSNDQVYEQLKLHIDTLFTVFQIKIDVKIFGSEQLRRLVCDLAYSKLVDNHQENLAIQPYIDELQNLVQSLTGSKNAKFDTHTGLSLALPLIQKDNGKKEINLDAFSKLKAKIEFLLEHQRIINSLGKKINYTDNPNFEEMRERLNKALAE